MTSIAKEFHRLLKKINRLTDGQASIDDVNWDESVLQNFNVTIRPNDGFYKGGKFVFTVTVPSCYPSELPPSVWCQTDIYHPNIDPTDEQWDEGSTNVCLNLFEAGMWNPSFGLEGLVHGLVFLMHNPNILDPLSPYFEDPTEESFEENVKKYMAGEPICDHEFNVDFITKQAVEPEHVEKDTSEQCDKQGENDKETGEADTTIVTEEKSGANGNADGVEDKAADSGISNSAEEQSDNKAEGQNDNVDNEVKSKEQITVATDHIQDIEDKLHNEINEQKNLMVDDSQDIHSHDDDFDDNDNAVVYDGECMFVPWTNSGDDTSVDTRECGSTETNAASSINADDCSNNHANCGDSKTSQQEMCSDIDGLVASSSVIDTIKALLTHVHHRFSKCTCRGDHEQNMDVVFVVEGEVVEQFSLPPEAGFSESDIADRALRRQTQCPVHMNQKKLTGGHIGLMFLRLAFFMNDCLI